MVGNARLGACTVVRTSLLLGSKLKTSSDCAGCCLLCWRSCSWSWGGVGSWNHLPPQVLKSRYVCLSPRREASLVCLSPCHMAFIMDGGMYVQDRWPSPLTLRRVKGHITLNVKFFWGTKLQGKGWRSQATNSNSEYVDRSKRLPGLYSGL